MFDVDAFLDRAKAAAGVDSDYALAVKVLGYKKASTVYNWRSGLSAPDERAILKLCALTGDDPVDVAVRIQSMRAANDDAAGLWRQVADRLKGGAQAIFPGAVLALVFAASLPDQAQAATFSNAFDAASLCVMSNAVMRLLWRIARLCRTRPARLAAQ